MKQADTPKVTEVVAALIWDGDRFLICQRPPHKTRGLMWEFVGGKVEAGETLSEALIRECREELDILVDVGPVFMEVLHTYPDLTVHLTLFHASISAGNPKLLEHHDLRWILVDEVDSFAFCPADDEILTRMKQCYASGTQIANRLFYLQDKDYRSFVCKLIPTADPSRVLGIRMPALRKLESFLHKTPEFSTFIRKFPHYFHEENHLHAIWISRLTDYRTLCEALYIFLPYVDNWAICDTLRPRISREDKPRFLQEIKRWLNISHPYTVRFAVEMLMLHYLDDAFTNDLPALLTNIHSDHYYVNMMIAWYFAEALSKQYNAILPYLQDRKLSAWIHNKTIQKALESKKISTAQKAELCQFKI